MEPVDGEALRIEIDGWEGPLDLLLSLARGQKVDLRQLSILALVEQYLAYIAAARALKLELAADYLVMAAWLAFLKSGLLLPKDPEADPDSEEMAYLLQRRLQRLDAMREAGARLIARDRLGRDVFARGAPEGLTVVRRPRWTSDLYDLIAAFGAVKARTAPVVHTVARRPLFTLEQALERVAALIAGRRDWTPLDRLLPPSADRAYRRSALASSFVAALELARQGRVEVAQAAAFAPLMLRVP